MSKDKIEGAVFRGAKWYQKSIDIRYMLNDNLTPDAKNLITFNYAIPYEDWILRRQAMTDFFGNKSKSKKALDNLRANGYAVLISRRDPITGNPDASGWFISPEPTAQEEATKNGWTILNKRPRIPEPLLSKDVVSEWVSVFAMTSQKTTGQPELLLPVNNQLDISFPRNQSEINDYTSNTNKELKYYLHNTFNSNEENIIERNEDVPTQKKKRKNPFAIIPKGTKPLLFEAWKQVYQIKFKTDLIPNLSPEQHRLLGTHIPYKIIKNLMQGDSGSLTPTKINTVWKLFLLKIDEKTFSFYPTPSKINKYFAEIMAKTQYQENVTSETNEKPKDLPKENKSVHDDLASKREELFNKINGLG